MKDEIKNNFECRHKWIPLLGRVGKKNVPTSLFTCLKCGDLKVGTRTIKISRYRLDMGDKPIKSIKTGTFNSEIDNGNSGTSTKTIDWTAGQKQKITTTGSCTLAFTAPSGPCNLMFRIIHEDSATAYTYTWPGTVKWPGGTKATTTNTANAVDIISFYYDGTNYYGVANTNFS
jgi:hypothetical protein